MARPSLADVAARAGTSTAVVSYVVNDGPRPVAAATRDRVRRAIVELGYRPNLVARALRTRRTDTVGLVVPDLRTPFFAELADAIGAAADDAGLQVLVAATRFDPGRERRQLRALVDARVDGTILVPTADVDGPLRDLRAADTPVVVAHRRRPAGRIDTTAAFVAVDDRAAGAAAAAHLIDDGYRRLVCLAGPADETPLGLRAAGFVSTATALGVEVAVAGCDVSDLISSAYRRTHDLLRGRNVPPDAVCATTDDHAVGALRAFADAGLRVGRDVGLIVVAGSAAIEFSTPSLTALRAPLTDLGERCVTALVRQLDGTAMDDIALSMSLQLGASCGDHAGRMGQAR